MTEDLFRPAIELGARVREGSLAAAALAEESLARIAQLDSELRAFTFLDAEGSRAQAAAAQQGDARPLAGVPVAIKDLTSVAGAQLTFGSDFVNFTGPHDSNAVARLRSAGATLVGLTSTPEFGLLAVTEPRRFGPARNPWDPARSPLGSSGGSAAAVAAGMVALAHGSDGGGSIRTPAAACGVVGHKPSRGRISRAPEAGDSFLGSDGVLARCVADSALALDLMSGYVPGDATWAAPEPDPFLLALASPPARLRIAITQAPPFETTVDPECARAVRVAAELLSDLGHEVIERAPDWHAAELVPAFTALWDVMAAQALGFAEAIAGRPAREDDVEPLTWILANRGRAVSAVEHGRALLALQAYSRRVVASFAAFDVLVTPATGRRPPAIGKVDACGPEPLKAFQQGWEINPFCPSWNVTGQPALTLPLDLGADGLPLAVQLVGRPLADAPLLALASQLEQAAPWQGRRPPGIP